MTVTYAGKPIGRSFGGETPFEKTRTGAIAVGRAADRRLVVPEQRPPA